MIDLAALYAKHASTFDSARPRRLMERPYLDFALERAPQPSRVLDIGCGAGEPIAQYFIDQACQVTGIDFVEEMSAAVFAAANRRG